MRFHPLPAGLAAVALLSASAPPAWQVYADERRHFAIEFPRDWAVVHNPFQILVATSPREDATDRYQENIRIVATDVPAGATLDTYYRNSLAIYRSVWHVRGVSDGQLAGVPARRVTLDQAIGAARSRILKVYALGHGQILVITCAAEPKKFELFLPVFEAALATLRFTPPARPHPRAATPVPVPTFLSSPEPTPALDPPVPTAPPPGDQAPGWPAPASP